MGACRARTGAATRDTTVRRASPDRGWRGAAHGDDILKRVAARACAVVVVATILSAIVPAFAPDALPWVVMVLVAAGLSLRLRQRHDA